jgi:hypothetical protein
MQTNDDDLLTLIVCLKMRQIREPLSGRFWGLTAEGSVTDCFCGARSAGITDCRQAISELGLKGRAVNEQAGHTCEADNVCYVNLFLQSREQIVIFSDKWHCYLIAILRVSRIGPATGTK